MQALRSSKATCFRRVLGVLLPVQLSAASWCQQRSWCRSRDEPRSWSLKRHASTARRNAETKSKSKLGDVLQTHPCFRDQPLLSDPNLLLQHLKGNVVHEDDAIIVVNKPSGIPVFQRPAKNDIKAAKKELGTPESEEAHRSVSIQELLPELQRELGSPDLCIALPAQREHSGVVVLGKTKESRDKIKLCQQHARTQKLQIFSYVVISSAVSPPPPHPSSTVIFSMKQIGDRFLPVVVERKSRAAQEKQQQLAVQMERSTLAWSPQSKALLSQVWASQEQEGWGCVETYMAGHLCPVLGDAVYSCGVHTILGIPVHVDPVINSNPQQVLSDQLLQALRVRRSQLHRLPVFVHRHKVSLNLPKQPPLEVSAPLPHSFMEALQRLQLQTYLGS